MTTTVVHTIKPAGGGHFSSLDAWVIGALVVGDPGFPGLIARNLVALDQIEVAEVYSGGSALVARVDTNQAGWVTDATHYMEIRGAVGHQHQGIWDTNKAYFEVTSGGPHAFVYYQVTHLTEMQGRCTVGQPFYMEIAGGANGNSVIDRCILIRTDGGAVAGTNSGFTGKTLTFLSSMIFAPSPTTYGLFCVSGTLNIYNCTLVATQPGGVGIESFAGTTNSQNNYIKADYCYDITSGVINKGSNDATSTTEAVTPALRSIPYSTANFVSVTPGSENLHLVVGSVLRDAGVTTPAVIDIDGRMRIAPFDIGADEYLDAPICWNYTARYKSSNKLFKASGCGSFPRNLRVPGNVDTSTGRMVDDGILINPDEYEAV